MKSNFLGHSRRSFKSLLSVGFIILSVIIASTSCNPVHKLQYLQGLDTARINQLKFSEPVIQKGDLLNIIVYSDNPQATALYNQQVAPVMTSRVIGADLSSDVGNQSQAAGYLVDKEGNIQFQGVGTLHVDGLTKAQLSDLLDSKLEKYLQNPYYNIRFLNYKITVLGDVANPAMFSIPSERINVLEAIALAGDLSITGRRDNVLVIREQNGKREVGRIDLTKPDIFNSPFFQLKQNDIVYVDLSKTKAATLNDRTLRNVTFATSLVSTIALIITIIRN